MGWVGCGPVWASCSCDVTSSNSRATSSSCVCADRMRRETPTRGAPQQWLAHAAGYLLMYALDCPLIVLVLHKPSALLLLSLILLLFCCSSHITVLLSRGPLPVAAGPGAAALFSPRAQHSSARAALSPVRGLAPQLRRQGTACTGSRAGHARPLRAGAHCKPRQQHAAQLAHQHRWQAAVSKPQPTGH